MICTNCGNLITFGGPPCCGPRANAPRVSGPPLTPDDFTPPQGPTYQDTRIAEITKRIRELQDAALAKWMRESGLLPNRAKLRTEIDAQTVTEPHVLTVRVFVETLPEPDR